MMKQEVLFDGITDRLVPCSFGSHSIGGLFASITFCLWTRMQNLVDPFQTTHSYIRVEPRFTEIKRKIRCREWKKKKKFRIKQMYLRGGHCWKYCIHVWVPHALVFYIYSPGVMFTIHDIRASAMVFLNATATNIVIPYYKCNI